MRVVICGGGMIGACTAYFLSRMQIEVVVVECTGIACAASGKSGGFLALNWCDGTPLRVSPGAAFHCMPSWPRRSTAAGTIAGSIP